ncbi:MAG: hypothetical protein M1833_007068 [Piccolia ochrophora]|nr:MAG: hypothetical protein M1833_007068 [Piccolia ochrophora]
MASSDPHQGGSITDMATDGTSVPGDAGVQRTIPSKPRPDQADLDNTVGGLGADNLAGAADNATDISRRTKDVGSTGEVLTGTGDQLPAEVESKNLHFGANDSLSKGHDRYDKHTRQKGSNEERYAGEGAEVDAAPGEENDDQDTLRERRSA